MLFVLPVKYHCFRLLSQNEVSGDVVQRTQWTLRGVLPGMCMAQEKTVCWDREEVGRRVCTCRGIGVYVVVFLHLSFAYKLKN